MKSKFCFLSICLSAVALFISCGSDIEINDISSAVSEVKDGNTIVLSNGLTVKLKGVSKTESSRAFLEKEVRGKNISLLIDEDDELTIDEYETEISAYVKFGRMAVNGYMLKYGFATFSASSCKDSSEVFREYSKGGGTDPDLPWDKLFTKCAPATFTIATAETGAVGTGFFINADGLAITNAHVYLAALKNVNTESEILIYLWDEYGKIRRDKYRKFRRLLDGEYRERVGKADWVVFYVDKDKDGEKYPFLKIAKEKIITGKEVAVLGTPAGEVGDYKFGSVCNEQGDKITITMDLNGGNSGGPIIKKNGEVVAIATWVDKADRSKRNYGYNIIPVREALDKMGESYGGKK